MTFHGTGNSLSIWRTVFASRRDALWYGLRCKSGGLFTVFTWFEIHPPFLSLSLPFSPGAVPAPAFQRRSPALVRSAGALRHFVPAPAVLAVTSPAGISLPDGHAVVKVHMTIVVENPALSRISKRLEFARKNENFHAFGNGVL